MKTDQNKSRFKSSTTEIYTHVSQSSLAKIKSPLDVFSQDKK